MPWINIVQENQAGKELSKVYQQIKSNRGKLSNIMMVQSLNPAAMKAHMEMYLAIMFHSSRLKREECEMIAVVVSKLNECDYCVNHHGEALNFYWRDETKIKNFIRDYQSVGLSHPMKSILEYAVKLTRKPQSVEESDIRNLKSQGLRDEEILDINLIVSYFNFVNRIANGLGVEFSEEEVRGYRY